MNKRSSGQGIRDYRDLKVWQKAYDLCLAVYRATEHFPGEERFGLTSQIRRAAVSIPSNIAEGCARGHRQEFVQFLSVARGSGAELETQLNLAKDLGYFRTADGLLDQYREVERMLAALIRSLRIPKATPDHSIT